jgi:putative protease
MSQATPPDLVCPAGSLRALKLAIDAGADAVYLGLRNATNARNFAGLNFDDDQLREGVAYAHARGRQVLMALNTFARADDPSPWFDAVDAAASFGADALICADVAVMAYARDHHPALRLHLSVQASATSHEAIAFYRRHYGIRRAVLPRVLTLSQVGQVLRHAGDVEIEVFGFGSLCVMVEGAEGVEARLNGLLIDRYARDEPRGYPTLCKGRFDVQGTRDYAIEEPTSLNTLAILPELMRLGVRAIKIEGRQRSPAYVEQVTQVWRQAIDAAVASPARFRVEPRWTAALGHLAEGQQHTLGAYDRPWR